MPDSALLLLSLITAFLGMFAFALVNDGHWRQLFGARPQTPGVRMLGRTAGVALLILSFTLNALADPVSMALLVWPMMLALAAATVAACLTLQSARSGPVKRKGR